jgi:hypothetical protein
MNFYYHTVLVSLAAIREGHRLDVLNNRNLFLIVLENGSPRLGCHCGQVLFRVLFLVCS